MANSLDRDRLHLLVMRDSAAIALEFVAGRKRGDLDNDAVLRFALAGAVEKLGRAASSVSDELRAQQPQIPWAKLIRLRKVLYLNDWQIEPDVVWNTIHADFPLLVDKLESLANATAKPNPNRRDVKMVDLPLDEICAYCKTQPIARLSLFGSALRNELTPESDIDLLVEYLPDAKVGFFDMSRHTDALGEIVGRKVDLGTFNSLSSYIRDEVVANAKLIYTREPFA